MKAPSNTIKELRCFLCQSPFIHSHGSEGRLKLAVPLQLSLMDIDRYSHDVKEVALNVNYIELCRSCMRMIAQAYINEFGPPVLVTVEELDGIRIKNQLRRIQKALHSAWPAGNKRALNEQVKIVLEIIETEVGWWQY